MSQSSKSTRGRKSSKTKKKTSSKGSKSSNETKRTSKKAKKIKKVVKKASGPLILKKWFFNVETYRGKDNTHHKLGLWSKGVYIGLVLTINLDEEDKFTMDIRLRGKRNKLYKCCWDYYVPPTVRKTCIHHLFIHNRSF